MTLPVRKPAEGAFGSSRDDAVRMGERYTLQRRATKKVETITAAAAIAPNTPPVTVAGCCAASPLRMSACATGRACVPLLE